MKERTVIIGVSILLVMVVVVAIIVDANIK